MPDPGTRRYLGTLALKIPYNATSTYTIGFKADETFAYDHNSVSIPILQLVPAVVQKWWMNRYLEIQPLPTYLPPPFNGPVYIQVLMLSIDRFPAFNGAARYVGVPLVFPNESGSPATFKSSPLQCTPVVLPMSNFDSVYLRGKEIVPNSVYLILVVLASNGQVLQQYTVKTAKWGDVYPPFYNGTTAQPDFDDISALVNKFKGANGAVHKAIGQLYADTPDPTVPVSFNDISECVNAFKAFGYPYGGPAACP